MDELPDVPALRVLEPPPRGLERLRERLAAPEGSPRRWWRVALPAFAIAALVVIVIALFRTPGRVVAPGAPPSAILDHEIGGGTTFYWVASVPGRRVAPTRNITSIEQASVVQDYQLP